MFINTKDDIVVALLKAGFCFIDDTHVSVDGHTILCEIASDKQSITFKNMELFQSLAVKVAIDAQKLAKNT